MTDNSINIGPPLTSLEVTPAQIDESSRDAVPVTTAQLFKTLRDESQTTEQVGRTISDWIAEGRITESTLAGKSDNKLSLLEWISDYAPMDLIQNGTIKQLIGLMSHDQVNEVGKNGQTPLMRIMGKSCATGLTQALIDRGADVNAANRDGCTVLMYCMRDCTSPDVLAALTNEGVHVNARDKDGNTALHHGVLRQNCGQIMPLIATGIDKAVKNEEGQTASDLAQQAIKERKWNSEDDDLVLEDLKFSQLDALISLGRSYGEAFCAKLQNASTIAWYAIGSAFSYALSVIPYKEVVIEETIPDSDGARAQPNSGGELPDEANYPEEVQSAVARTSTSYVGAKIPSSAEPTGVPMNDVDEASTPAEAGKPSGI